MYNTLKNIFGFQSFRPNQEAIVRSILNRQDVFAAMPTGGGKSLCYQLPAKILSGTTLVVSPLISLMKDQVDAALENGISAALLNSSLSSQEASAVYHKLFRGALDLLYVAPERLAMDHFVEKLHQVHLSLFAIDEAHCISEWGHDFRPDYLSLSILPQRFPQIPIAAFTATATEQVQQDIIHKLGLRNPLIIRASFNRGNLFYQVDRKKKGNTQIIDFLKEYGGQAGIIYRATRDSVEQTAKFLSSKGFLALPYHAGLPIEVRQKNQEAFNRDEVEVIVATIAFGMGIDKSNVRFVVHMDLPKNIENYYQETGRAGRDGSPAHCRLFFSAGDILKQKYFLEQMTNEQEKGIANEKLKKMIRFATHYICRRRQLLKYFSEIYPQEKCDSCDVCLANLEKTDATKEAQIFLSAVVRTQQKYGIGHIIDIVTGAKTKRISQLRHNRIKTYAKGEYKSKDYWRFLVDEMLVQNLIEQDGGRYPILCLTSKGVDTLYKGNTFLLIRREMVTSKVSQEESCDEILFQKLRHLRKEIAQEQGVPPFIIFSDKTLREISSKYPQTLSEVEKIGGIGKVKLEQYGDDLVRLVREYQQERAPLESEVKEVKEEKQEENSQQSKINKNPRLNKTYELFQQGLSLEEIAEQSNLLTATISGHIEMLIQEGWDIDMDRLVPPEKCKEIIEFFQKQEGWFLSPVVEYFGGRVDYDEAKFVRGYLKALDKK